MDSNDFDRVKVEKANAIARYRRFRNIAKLLKIIEVVVALTLISWSSTRLPSAVKSTVEYLLQLSVYLLKPHVVFLIGNAIVIALFVLSRQKEAGNDDLHADYVGNSEAHQRIASASDGESPPPATLEETAFEDKQMVCSENAASLKECEAVATAIEQATKQIHRFQRTQSEKLKPEITVKPRRELRRSETDMGRLLVTSSDRRTMTSIDMVEKLSNEDFRLTVEAFIEKQQRFLMAQKIAEKDQ